MARAQATQAEQWESRFARLNLQLDRLLPERQVLAAPSACLEGEAMKKKSYETPKLQKREPLAAVTAEKKPGSKPSRDE